MGLAEQSHAATAASCARKSGLSRSLLLQFMLEYNPSTRERGVATSSGAHKWG